MWRLTWDGGESPVIASIPAGDVQSGPRPA
jgi:hypothetical protein